MPSTADRDTERDARASSLRLTGVWVSLLLLTLLSLYGLSGLQRPTLIGAVLALALLKGQLVADHFMGLRRVAWAWRGALSLYLAIVCGLLALAFWSA